MEKIREKLKLVRERELRSAQPSSRTTNMFSDAQSSTNLDGSKHLADLNSSDITRKKEDINWHMQPLINLKKYLKDMNISPDLDKTYLYTFTLDNTGKKEYQVNCNELIKRLTSYSYKFSQIIPASLLEEGPIEKMQNQWLSNFHHEHQFKVFSIDADAQSALGKIRELSKELDIENKEEWNNEITILIKSINLLIKTSNLYSIELNRLNHRNTLFTQSKRLKKQEIPKQDKERNTLGKIYRKEILLEIAEFLLPQDNSNEEK